MGRSPSLFIISFLFLTYSYGQSKSDKQLVKSLDELLSGQFKQNEPGVAILMAKNEKVVYEKAFGSANIELNVPMQPDMVFRVGSITKQFTAVGILQLIEQGKISLQDSVQKYIKDFPSKGYAITIENLLTHTSGLIDYASMNDPDPYIERRDFTGQFIIDYFKKESLQFKPGTKYGYSNSNYALLAYIMEKITGKSYHRYMEEKVIKQAGLTNTYYANEHAIVPKRVTGYTRDRGFYENCEYQTISLGYGCGDLMSTVADLYKWNNALFAYKLVKKETLEKAFTPYKLNDGTMSSYGYGWFIDKKYGRKCVHHEGQVSGFIAMEKYFPDENIYTAILTNLKSGEDTTDFSDKRFRLFEKVFSLSLGNELPVEIAVSDSILESYVGTYQGDKIFNSDGTFKIYREGDKMFNADSTSFQIYKGKDQLITIRKENKKLFATLSNGSGKNMMLLPQTETFFLLPDVERIKTTIEFVVQNRKPVELYWTQEHKSGWKKIN